MTPTDENKRNGRYPKRMSADLLPTLCPSRIRGLGEAGRELVGILPQEESFSSQRLENTYE